MLDMIGKFRAALAVFVLVASASRAFAQAPTAWQLVWSDEFDGPAGSAPNPQNWTLTQGLTPDGAQSYNCLFGQTTNGCNPAQPNVSLDGNGHLAIVARSAAGAPNGVTSGRLSTSAGTNNSTILFSTQYGRIEASITLPSGSGNQGVWPAFWMLGNNIASINWPSCGEIDIMEYIGAANPTQIFGTLHGQGYPNTGLGIRATNSAGWTGSHIFGIIWSPNQIQFYVDSLTNAYGTISTADLMASQPWVNGGLAAWPFNNPFFILLDLNMGGPFPGNVSSATTFPQTMLVDYVRVYRATPPGPPTNVSATVISQSQVNLNWTASTNTDATYNVYRSLVSGTAPASQAQPNPNVVPQSNQTLIANKLTTTSYTDANLSPGQTYFYTVTASGGYSGESAGPEVRVTTAASGVGANGGALSVSAAGYSGTGNYIVNSLVSGGFTNAFTATIDTSLISNPAPQDVYHAERWGPQSWVIAHLTPGGSYNLRMHFAETAFGAAGQRQFNVLVNGKQVLTNFDIFATAGAQNRAITQTINTVADRNGAILLQLAPGAADQPEIRALDVTPSMGGQLLGQAAGSTTSIAVNSGGPVQGTFQADVNGGNFGLPTNPLTAGGGTNTTTQTISTAGLTNPAPAAVYQTERFGQFGYIFTSLAPNAAYTVRLHFAEGVTANNARGDRLFNVLVNGNQVLTNFDIFGAAGAINQGVIQQVSGVPNEFGVLSVQFTAGAANLPSLRGIEVVSQGSVAPPAAPTALAATAISSSQINLSWTASATAGVQYQVFRATTSGFTPSTSNLVAGGLTSTTFSDTGLATATAYFYLVEAVNLAGNSPPSNQASATTASGTTGGVLVAINAGGPVVGSFAADKNFSGGTAASTANAIVTTGVTGAAPQQVYQSERFGASTYTIPGLTAGTSYTVRLHFAEFFWTRAGQRIFSVGINGATVLNNFDIIATAGAANKALVESFTATANASGQIVINFTTGSADLPKVSGVEIAAASSTPVVVTAINSGGPAVGSFAADKNFSGGTAASTANAIVTTGVTGAAPQQVYQSERFGASTYTIPGLTAGTSYTVRLHFAEFFWTKAGQRIFSVSINGATVLSNFDIIATAGSANKALVETFTATANASGQIVINFTTGSADLPKVSGIEVAH